MTNLTQTVERLRETSAELKRRGIDDLAQTVDRVIADLNSSSFVVASNLITTGEAAQMLGVRSVNTIKRWAGDGVLEGFRRGGRVLVTRASVEAMLNDSRLARYKKQQQELDEALAPFDAGDRPLPRSDILWDGRKPWETHGTGEHRSDPQ
jgi:excisionase family DNA binding protein